MRMRREPFYGMPEDAHLLPASERERFDMVASMGDGTTEGQPTVPVVKTVRGPFSPHPDAVEKGVELPLGYHQHQGENRTQRRTAVATWVPPKVEGAPTRRALWKQRQKQRRGKLDPELRRLQRKATK